jgi:hypothetical protein
VLAVLDPGEHRLLSGLLRALLTTLDSREQAWR